MFGNGAYLKISDRGYRKISERSAVLSCYTSKKNEEGSYVTDFNGIVRFVGNAAKVIMPLLDTERVSVKITSCAIDGGLYDPETKTNGRYNFTVFDCENANAQSAPSAPQTAPKVEAKPKPPKPKEDDDIQW